MLSILIWLPILGAAIIGFLPASVPSRQIRNAALTVTGVTLLWTLWLFTQFDLSSASFQLREYLPWIETLGMNYELAMDGLALVMLGINSLLTWIALLSAAENTERPRLFYSMILLICGGVAGAFLAQNLLLFFLFYELGLVPFYLLISIWGGEKRGYAAIKFLIYTAMSGALILGGFPGSDLADRQR